MISMPLPMTQTEFKDFILGITSETLEGFSIHWPWRPYHRVGFNALKYAAEHNWDLQELGEVLGDLSCPTPPKNLLEKFQASGALDGDGRILTLDVEVKIRETLSFAGENLNLFKKSDIYLPSTNDLFPLLHKTKAPSWKPDLSTFSTALEHYEKYFQGTSPWAQLAFLERVEGLSKPSSTLHFQRIYGN